MTGRPQREKPKPTVRLEVGEDIYAAILPLLRTDVHSFASLSQLVETIIFLSEHVYVAEPPDNFVIELSRLRAQRIIAQIKNPQLNKSRFIHVTLDVDAIAFLDLLVEKYHMLFRNRSEVVELFLLYIGGNCDSREKIRYYAQRLAEVLSLHPMRTR